MKLNRDHVTNSSSISFVLEFHTEKPTPEEFINDIFPYLTDDENQIRHMLIYEKDPLKKSFMMMTDNERVKYLVDELKSNKNLMRYFDFPENICYPTTGDHVWEDGLLEALLHSKLVVEEFHSAKFGMRYYEDHH